MKTLDQVEARTPISSAPFTINASGSYFLAGNLPVASGNGVTVNADNVTLDLNGFTIASTASPASGTGVRITGNDRNVTIQNGNIRGTTTFAPGTFTTGGFQDAITDNGVNSANVRVVEVNVSGVANQGIDLADIVTTRIVEHCNVDVCGGLGIRAGEVRNCAVRNAGAFGVRDAHHPARCPDRADQRADLWRRSRGARRDFPGRAQQSGQWHDRGWERDGDDPRLPVSHRRLRLRAGQSARARG